MSQTAYDIAIKNVKRVYNVARGERRKERFLAIDDFSLEVKSGEFAAIVGPSGCGKSTLLDLIAGLNMPDSGEILINGEKITGPALDRGLVMQGYALYPWRTVTQNIQFGLELQKKTKKDRIEISREFLELVGLTSFENRYPYELSGGMQQRVAIARALAYDPKILLMDEPFAAVDAQTRETLQEELLKIWGKTGKTIIFITHSIEEAVFLAQRVVVMTSNPGKVKEIIDVDIPYPRNPGNIKHSPNFQWIANKVWKSLHNQDECQLEHMEEGRNIENEINPQTML